MTWESTYTPQQAFARHVLTVAVNGGINRWARVHGYQWDCPPEQVRAEGIDTRDGRSLWCVDLADVQRAIDKLIDSPEDCFAPDSRVDPQTRTTLPVLLRLLRDEHADTAGQQPTLPVDIAVADMVIQVAVADEVIYS